MPEPSTFKPVTDAVKQAVTDIGKNITSLGQEVTSKFRQTFDEEMEEVISWGESFFNKINKIFSPFLTSISQWFLQTEFAKKSSNFLKKLLGIELRREKREIAQQGLGKKSFLDSLLKGIGMFLAGAAFLMGATIGAITAPLIGQITEPLRLIGKALTKFWNLKSVKMFKNFLKDPFGLSKVVLGKTGPIGRFIRWIGDLGKSVESPMLLKMARKSLGILGKVFSGISKMGMWIMKSPLGRGFLAGFRFGMKWIFWPIQIILSAIDFVKGFAATNGGLYDKFVGGIKNVVSEFFRLPFELFGKLIDWVASEFGIENLGAEKFITSAFDGLVDVIFSIPIAIKNWLKTALGTAIDWAKNNISFASVSEAISGFFNTVIDSIATFLWDFIKDSDIIRGALNLTDQGKGLMKFLETRAEGVQEREMSEYERKQLQLAEKQQRTLENIEKKTLGDNTVAVTQGGDSGGGRMVPDVTKDSRDIMFAPAFE